MQQRALAAAGCARQCDALATRDLEIDAAQHRDLVAGRAVSLGQIADAQYGFAAGHVGRARLITWTSRASGISARTRRSAVADETPRRRAGRSGCAGSWRPRRI